FFSSRRRHTRFSRDWSSDVCSSDLDRFRGQSARRTFQERALLSRYSSKLEQVALALQQGAPVERACADLLSSPGVARCYLLDARSEERRVGKECRGRWWPEQYTTNA